MRYIHFVTLTLLAFFFAPMSTAAAQQHPDGFYTGAVSCEALADVNHYLDAMRTSKRAEEDFLLETAISKEGETPHCDIGSFSAYRLIEFRPKAIARPDFFNMVSITLVEKVVQGVHSMRYVFTYPQRKLHNI